MAWTFFAASFSCMCVGILCVVSTLSAVNSPFEFMVLVAAGLLLIRAGTEWANDGRRFEEMEAYEEYLKERNRCREPNQNIPSDFSDN